MSLRFMDSFDHYATADILKKWTSTANSPTIQSGGYHGSTGCLKMTSSTVSVSKKLDNQQSWTVGFALKTFGYTSNNVILSLVDSASSTTQCSLLLLRNGVLQICRGTGTAVTGGKSTLALKACNWYWIEFHVTIADSITANSCAVWVNDYPWATVATGQDLKAHATTTTADTINLFGVPGTVGGQNIAYFDDVIICDGQAGLYFPIGHSYVDILYPTADGTINDWTASTGGRSSCVDEASQNGDTDYISASTAGNVQLFNVSDVGHSLSWCDGIQVNSYARSDSANTYIHYPLIRSNATTYAMTTQAFTASTTYVDYRGILETDPTNSNASWTGSVLDALEAGVKLQSVT